MSKCLARLGSSVALLALAALAAAQPAATPEAALATGSAFLADPSLPTFPQGLGTVWDPDKQHPYFRITLENRGGATSYLRVAETGGRVIEFDALLPPPPLPDATLPREQARQIALDFARRHLPELFADGGEVKVEPQEKIAANGAYTFDLLRLEQQVRVPMGALVGVRVYDGKVVHWTLRQTPVTVSLTPGVNLEQAQASATASLAKGYYTPVQWLDGYLEAIKWGKEQKLVWRVWVQAKRPQEAPEYLGDIWQFDVDAADGKIARTNKMGGRERYEYYVRMSGKQMPPWPTPDPVSSDGRAAVSPDGRRLLFASTRVRAGYPRWLPSRAWGLFVAKADGTELSCLVREAVGSPRWRSASEVAYLGGSSIVLLNLDDGRRTVLKPQEGWQYGAFVSLPDGRLVTVACFKQSATRLVALDPAQPEAPGVELPSKGDFSTRHAALALDAQGRLLYTMRTETGITTTEDPRRRKEAYRLCRLDLKAAPPAEEMLVEYLLAGSGLQWGPQGLLYLRTSEPGAFQTVDVANGATGQWRAPTPLQPEAPTPRRLSPENLVFAEDGQSLLFTSYYASGRPGEVAAEVIYSCALDGSGLRLMTRPESGAARPFVFPATGQAAFQ